MIHTAIHPALSASEWAAVSIALQDAQRCGCTAEAADGRPGTLRGISNFLFGRRRPNRLADPRLEAVRRFVCASYRRRDSVGELARPLAEHGFTAAQIHALGLLSR